MSEPFCPRRRAVDSCNRNSSGKPFRRLQHLHKYPPQYQSMKYFSRSTWKRAVRLAATTPDDSPVEFVRGNMFLATFRILHSTGLACGVDNWSASVIGFLLWIDSSFKQRFRGWLYDSACRVVFYRQNMSPSPCHGARSSEHTSLGIIML